MEIAKENDRYATKDLYEAAYLYAKGEKFVGIEPAGSQYFFIFYGKTVCEKAASQYWQGSGLINPKSMSDGIRSLKDLIFSRR